MESLELVSSVCVSVLPGPDLRNCSNDHYYVLELAQVQYALVLVLGCWERHRGLLWFAVIRRQRHLYHFADKIPERLLGPGLLNLHIWVTEVWHRPD